MSRVLWGIGTPRTLRPLWTLAELGLKYEHRRVAPRSPAMDAPDFAGLNRRHKVPFYQDDRVTIGESAAIVIYLADRYGGDKLPMPEPGSAARAILLDHALYIMTEIDARMYTVRLHGAPPGGLAGIYGDAPAAVAAALRYAGNSLREAARWLEGGRAYLTGARFGVADILLGSCLGWAQGAGIELPDELAGYHARIAERPGYRAAVVQNDPANALP